MDLSKKHVRERLEIAQKAKKEHKEKCDDDSCTACHFWSGTISALSALLGEPGVID